MMMKPILRPNRKVTEFFPKKPRTGPLPDQPVYDISSSSDQSIISISSDDVPPINRKLSELGPNAVSSTRVTSQSATSSHRRGDTRSNALYISSSPEPSSALLLADRVFSSSALVITRDSTRSDNVLVVRSKKHIPVPVMPKTSAKKRKKPPVTIISSEDSDGPVFPVIRVKPSSRDKTSSAPKSHLHNSIDEVIANLPSMVPLSQRQNILTPSKSPGKFGPAISRSASKGPRLQHSPSPPKRARHDSPATCDKPSPSIPAPAESGNAPPVTSRSPSRTTILDIHCHLDDNQVNITVPAASSASCVPDDNADDDREDRAKVVNEQPAWKTTPRGEAQDTSRNSQQDEMELSMDHDVTGIGSVDPPEHQSLVSPSKLRAEGIIARIKARAEEEAAAQAHTDRNQSSSLMGSDGDSDPSSLSSLSDDDDQELQLELSALGTSSNGNIVKTAGCTSFGLDSSSSAIGVRRSTRHENDPPPNYAKRLELFRNETPPPSKQQEKLNPNAKTRSKTLVSSCPLDFLLEDHEREDARRLKAEKKRKGNVSGTRGSSPVSPDQHPGVFATPLRRRRHAETESPGSVPSESDMVEDDVLMCDAEREELLGKEDAVAVGKILAGDRAKGKGKKKEVTRIAFWDSVEETRHDTVPEMTVKDDDSPFLKSLSCAIDRGDYDAASLLVDSGVLSAVSMTVRLLKWLFLTAMSTAHPTLSTSAYRALLVLQRERSRKDSQVQLSSDIFLASLFKFGVNPRMSSLLAPRALEKTAVVEASQNTKVLTICRFVILLEALGRSSAVESDGMPSVVLSLLLLALDCSTEPECQQDVVGAIESLLGSSEVTRTIELGVCKSIAHATSTLEFSPAQEVQLLALLPGCGASSGRVRRWTAWAMLGGDLSGAQECGDVPPFEVFSSLFTEMPIGGSRLHVDNDTDYETLGATVEILSVALTDVDAYILQEPPARGAGSGSNDSLYDICKALEWIDGKIVDTRAAHLDRTRAKDAINRLHKRLLYQRHATLELMRGNAGKIDRFVTKTSPNAEPKPRPKPANTTVKSPDK